MAQGSQTTFGGWEPRTCCICDLPIVKSHDSPGGLRFDFNHATQVGRSWHVRCEVEHGWPVAA